MTAEECTAKVEASPTYRQRIVEALAGDVLWTDEAKTHVVVVHGDQGSFWLRCCVWWPVTATRTIRSGHVPGSHEPFIQGHRFAKAITPAELLAFAETVDAYEAALTATERAPDAYPVEQRLTKVEVAPSRFA